jgi:glycosyltransferase involved in cell wall biosynthesis
MTRSKATETTFVVIAYNEAGNIQACIRAILAQRGVSSTRLVVVDDGSTDNTAEIVRALQQVDPRIELISQQNAGRGAARARGVSVATGELIAMVDADVILPPHWWETCAANLDGVQAVGGVAIPDGDVAYLCRRFGLNPKATLPMPVAGSNALYCRELLSVRGFDPGLREGEDTDLNLRMAREGRRARLIPDLYVEHREHKSFGSSVIWLFHTGSGATRHLLRYRRLRVPDLVWVGFLVAAGVTMRSGRHAGWRVLIVPGYIITSASAHLVSRFHISLAHGIDKILGGVAVNSVLIASYLLGRSYGMARWGFLPNTSQATPTVPSAPHAEEPNAGRPASAMAPVSPIRKSSDRELAPIPESELAPERAAV